MCKVKTANYGFIFRAHLYGVVIYSSYTFGISSPDRLLGRYAPIKINGIALTVGYELYGE